MKLDTKIIVVLLGKGACHYHMDTGMGERFCTEELSAFPLWLNGGAGGGRRGWRRRSIEDKDKVHAFIVGSTGPPTTTEIWAHSESF